MNVQLEFLPLLLLLFLAFLVPPALSRFRWLPVVVGEILVGMIIGRSGFNIVRPDATLEFLAEIGLAVLMFLSGLEVDFTLLTSPAGSKRRLLSPLLLAAVSFFLSLGLAAFTARELVARGLTNDLMMVGLILSTTSLGIVLPVLKERGLSSGPYGQTVLLSALLADFVTMLLITVYVTLKSKGLTLEILLVGLLFVAALAALRLGRRFLPQTKLDLPFGDIIPASSQTRLHGSIALLLAFVILASLLGAEMILGAFLAGAVLSLLNGPRQSQLRGNLEAIGFGFFIPVFFLMVGVDFDLPALLRSRKTWVLAPVLLVTAYLIKILPALVFKLRFSWKETLGGGILLSSRLSLIIAASGIGLRLGVIDESTNAAFVLIAALTATISPVLFNALVPARKFRDRSAVAIVGNTDLALQTARELASSDEKVFFLEIGSARAEAARQAGFPVLSAFKGKAGLPPLKNLLVLTEDDDRNAEICGEARRMGFSPVIVLVNDPARLDRFAAPGVQTFTPGLYRATLLALMARHPDLFHIMTSGRAGHQVREALLVNESFGGKPMRELQLGADILILSIRRGQESLIPHGDTKLALGDWVTIYGQAESVEALQARFESS
ncbi:MAG: cation:proton antiporter [Candidatus Aminicenantes bacterium]|nr:cation:proton antiporter [Candidatus Aminicenantes bacterium]